MHEHDDLDCHVVLAKAMSVPRPTGESDRDSHPIHDGHVPSVRVCGLSRLEKDIEV
jgi:hypothetical protein